MPVIRRVMRLLRCVCTKTCGHSQAFEKSIRARIFLAPCFLFFIFCVEQDACFFWRHSVELAGPCSELLICWCVFLCGFCCVRCCCYLAKCACGDNFSCSAGKIAPTRPSPPIW